MKTLKTILFLFISIAAWSQQDSTKLDTVQLYMIVEDALTEKPVQVYEARYIVQSKGNQVLGSLIQYIDKGKWVDYTRKENDYITLIPKKK